MNALFAQRKNLISPRFYGLLLEILRFNREAKKHLAIPFNDSHYQLTLGEFLAQHRFSAALVNQYIIPMCAAIWSSPPATMMKMPLPFFLRFFHNHGLFNLIDKPTWRVVTGGSVRYVERLIEPFRDRIHFNTPVMSIQRHPQSIAIKTAHGDLAHFDHVFIATHSNQALKLLADPSPAETAVLGAIPYQKNEVVLHTDSNLLPRSPLARSSWNYHIPSATQHDVSVTYYMNKLQNLNVPTDFCVTLNSTALIHPSKILQTFQYSHPVFTPESVAAQKRHGEISGLRRTHYCGAYWAYGFHEDGVNSAYEAVERFSTADRLAA